MIFPFMSVLTRKKFRFRAEPEVRINEDITPVDLSILIETMTTLPATPGLITEIC